MHLQLGFYVTKGIHLQGGERIMDLEHPAITRANKTGYPSAEPNRKAVGVDYFGNEYFEGEDIIIDIERGEAIQKDSLEDYLSEVLGFKFTKAK